MDYTAYTSMHDEEVRLLKQHLADANRGAQRNARINQQLVNNNNSLKLQLAEARAENDMLRDRIGTEINGKYARQEAAREIYNLIMDTELHHELGFTVADAIKHKFELNESIG